MLYFAAAVLALLMTIIDVLITLSLVGVQSLSVSMSVCPFLHSHM